MHGDEQFRRAYTLKDKTSVVRQEKKTNWSRPDLNVSQD